nr:hypothetical protein [uncultured Dongia sp.]
MAATDNKALIAEKQKRLRQRNWALAGALILFVVLVFVISVVKMGGA